MKCSDKYKESFDFNKTLADYQTASGNIVDKQVSRELCGLYKIIDKNKQLVLLCCKSELELFLFSWSLK